ncbi:DUF3306 domain-containing protein [Vibrio europaeus]|uniref:hypothetical protein n=1 Tax=Vibrio europaeus TaxID=300876 RepID=UPI00234007B1|nr:hypothetical protein [Vibrio europaeus]MDC5851362.1 DUF3306 domain-containing protein [Vibrio europaeus]
MATSFFNRWSKKKLEGESASQDEPCVNIELDVVETESETAGELEAAIEPRSQEVGDAEQSDEEEMESNAQLMSSDDDLAKHEEVEEQTKSDSSQSIESTETVGQNIPHKG